MDTDEGGKEEMNEKGKGRKEGLKEEWSLTRKKEKTRQRKERLSEGDEEGQQREQRKGRKEDEKEVEKGEKFEEGSKKDREGERKVFSRGLKRERESGLASTCCTPLSVSSPLSDVLIVQCCWIWLVWIIWQLVWTLT